MLSYCFPNPFSLLSPRIYPNMPKSHPKNSNTESVHDNSFTTPSKNNVLRTKPARCMARLRPTQIASHRSLLQSMAPCQNKLQSVI